MKKVLILCYDFPPYNSIGSQRPYSWFKYFRDFGLSPTVVTRHWDVEIKSSIDCIKPSGSKVTYDTSETGTIIRVPYRSNLRDRFILRFGLTRFSVVRRALSFVYHLSRFLLAKPDNTRNLYDAARESIRENGCDLIIASGEPFILFQYASNLAKEFSIPWVADFRDGWSTDSAIKSSDLINGRLVRWYYRMMEKRMVRSASLITTAAPPYAEELESVHPKKPVKVIYNGYEEKDFVEIDQIPQGGEQFEIAYIGTIYPYQKLEVFLEGYRKFILKTKVKKTRAVFYGLNFYAEQKVRLSNFDPELVKFVDSTDRFAHDKLLPLLKRANILLLLADSKIEALAAKVFEYLPLGRKILLVKNDNGILHEILTKCEGGISNNTSDEVANTLELLYGEYLRKGYIEHQSVNYEQYTRRNQCKKLAQVLKNLLGVNDVDGEKRVLILAHDFPPYNSIGAQRPYSWYKYFKKSGLHPVVVTRHWDEDLKTQIDYVRSSKIKSAKIKEDEFGTIIRAPYMPNLKDRFILKFGLNRFVLIRKMLSFSFAWGRFYSPRLDSTANIFREAEKYLQTTPCHLIIATGEPFILFKYGSKLSSKYNIPWIPDYRDGWTTDTLYTRSEKLLLKYGWQGLEKQYLKNCSLITTVGPSYKKDLESLQSNKRIELVFNGYDFKDLIGLDTVQQSSDCFQIAYAGTIYDLQPLEVFLEGYMKFIEQENCTNTKAYFYGVNLFEEQKQRVFSFNEDLNKHLIATDRIPYEEVMKELKRANVLLLLASESYQSIHVKTFEYLALNRKILFVKDDKGDMSKILAECNGGIKCNSAEDVTTALIESYREFSKNGEVSSDSKNYIQYSRKNQSEVLADIINAQV